LGEYNWQLVKRGESNMQRSISIGIIGDYNPEKISHPATNAAIQHAAKQLSIQADYRWIPTPAFLTDEGRKSLVGFDCIWAASGSPYRSSDGALKGIQVARELDKPFIGT
jgi:CTP synthase (UTP-ammonia lyase)